MGARELGTAARRLEEARRRLEAVLGAKRAAVAGIGATARPATFAEALERVEGALDRLLDAGRDEKAAEVFIPDFVIEFTRKEVEIEDPDGEVGDTISGDPQGVLDGALAEALDILIGAGAPPLAIRAVEMLRDTAEFGVVTEFSEEHEDDEVDPDDVSALGGEA
jgi:hypothetical protein